MSRHYGCVGRNGTFALCLGITAACLEPSALVAQKGPAQTTERNLPIVVLLETNWGRVDATRAVVRTREEFERYWLQAHLGIRSPHPLPEVDFTRDMLIVAALGRQPGAGSQIAVATVKERRHRLEITLDLGLVPTDCDGFSGVTYPTVFVRVPASLSTVVFRDRVVQGRCSRPVGAGVAKVLVPMSAPDSMAGWVRSPSSWVTNPRRISGQFVRDIVIVRFVAGATQRQRQEAIDAVNGAVVGGVPYFGGVEGAYYVKIPGDTTNERVFLAIRTLEKLPQVRQAMPDLISDEGFSTRPPSEPVGDAVSVSVPTVRRAPCLPKTGTST